MQVPLVIIQGSKSSTVDNCVKKQRLCTEGETCDVLTAESEKTFSDWILKLGDGRSGATVVCGHPVFHSRKTPTTNVPR
jgi:hypothetical protein